MAEDVASVIITVHAHDHIYHTITITNEDTWVSLLDKICEKAKNIYANKSPYTGHYNHAMYYLIYYPPKINTGPRCGRCSTQGKPIEEIDPTHFVSINFAAQTFRCCECCLIPRSECIICRRLRTKTGFIHNLYCGHELFCLQCADLVNEKHLTHCPVCDMDNVQIVGAAKCYKCHKFVHSYLCELKS